MKKILMLLTVISLVLSSCHANKPLVKQERLAKVNTLLESENWKVFFDSAAYLRSLDVKQLFGSEYLEVTGNNVDINLTFIGSVDLAKSNFTRQQSERINVQNKILRAEKKFDEKRGFYTVSMLVQSGNETFTLSIKVYSNRKAIMTIRSNFRNPVNYYGTLQPV